MPRSDHNPWDSAIVMTIHGYCNHCHHRGSARLTAYYDKTILIRCNNCKTANDFSPDDSNYNNPDYFAPFMDDEDPGDPGPDKYTKGRR